jgi:hypothetical protein
MHCRIEVHRTLAATIVGSFVMVYDDQTAGDFVTLSPDQILFLVYVHEALKLLKPMRFALTQLPSHNLTNTIIP